MDWLLSLMIRPRSIVRQVTSVSLFHLLGKFSLTSCPLLGNPLFTGVEKADVNVLGKFTKTGREYSCCFIWKIE